MREVRAAVSRLQSLREERQGRASQQQLRAQELGEKRSRGGGEGGGSGVLAWGSSEEDRVVSFSARGFVVSVLRSTLLNAAPDSWFAARVSGRWTEQADDVDEDGNIYQVRRRDGCEGQALALGHGALTTPTCPLRCSPCSSLRRM